MITFQAKLSKAEVQFDDGVIEFLVRYYIETPDLKRKEMGMVSRALTILEAFRAIDRLETEAAKKEIERSLALDKEESAELLGEMIKEGNLSGPYRENEDVE